MQYAQSAACRSSKLNISHQHSPKATSCIPMQNHEHPCQALGLPRAKWGQLPTAIHLLATANLQDHQHHNCIPMAWLSQEVWCSYNELVKDQLIQLGQKTYNAKHQQWILNWLPEIFTEQMKDNHSLRANHIKCQASEMIPLIHVMAIFTMHVLMKMGCTAESNVWLAIQMFYEKHK